MSDVDFGMFVQRELDRIDVLDIRARMYGEETFSEEYKALLLACATRGHWDAIADAMSWVTDQQQSRIITWRAEEEVRDRNSRMAFSVECPYCGAAEGSACVVGAGHQNAGKEIGGYHSNRLRHAQHIQYKNS